MPENMLKYATAVGASLSVADTQGESGFGKKPQPKRSFAPTTGRPPYLTSAPLLTLPLSFLSLMPNLFESAPESPQTSTLGGLDKILISAMLSSCESAIRRG